uniref:Uncharacterized protein n=1 Tax=Siphoviridae sp. ctrfD19 TaxID=2826478 RepID=A0A8S5M2H5_9CAUD|nr:MAG TPA: hypothetical protein [Siphoviridae sp. ctrfD19]DAL04310.1 MAG TPA: hypothetical protein [Caudoviricetes sp.]
MCSPSYYLLLFYGKKIRPVMVLPLVHSSYFSFLCLCISVMSVFEASDAQMALIISKTRI